MSSTLDPPGQALSAEQKRRLLGQLLQRRAARATRFPLSFAQQRLWFLHQLDPASPLYNMFSAFRLRGPVDAAALERAFAEIVQGHEVLRTVFAAEAGEPVQVVTPAGSWRMEVEELGGLGEAEREARVRRRVRAEAVRPFDLAAGPLFRALLLRCGPEEHVLFVCVHHIVSDGWSMEVLFRELDAVYAAFLRGEPSPLAEPPIQYADFAVWQRERLRGPALEQLIGYWREQLAGAPATLELPTDRPRPAAQSFRGATLPLSFDAALTGKLHRAARREGGTLFMTLLAAFGVLLARYAGAGEVVVGTPIAGRTRRETEGLIGLFINTLALRVDLSGDPAFTALVGRVRETVLGAHAHQELPFDKLVEELQVERSLSHAPVFQALLSMQGLPRPMRLGDVAALPFQAETGTSKFDLSLVLQEEGPALYGYLEYGTDLFEAATAERMRGHLRTLLEGIADDPERRVSRLPLLDAAERAQVVEAWNRTARPYPRGVCIHELFEAQAAVRPDAPALAWGEVELTYAQLDARANRLAHHLRGLGVGPDGRVGVLLERGVDLVVSILAVLKAGGCYVPLDPGYPAERLRTMLDDSSVRVLVSRADAAFAAEAGDVPVVLLDRAADALDREPADAPRSGATAENLAYIVYTSGSTGRPKGVMVAHRHVVQLAVETDYVRFQPGDRVAQASNASFDALTFEAWGALMNGATLVGIPRDVLLAPAAFRETLREQGITTLYQTTALLNQLSREQPDIFSPLREVLFGGQAADADSVRRLLAAGRPRRLLHMYGPTETTAWCSYEQVEQVAGDALTVSVGRATGNQRIYLLDAALEPVPVGVPGEAYVGGDGVVRGYLDRPELTAERFLPDPFAAEAGTRMYRTGDRLRWRADGKLEFVGRVDEQVKVRGFRIEPGEIEAVLSAHPGVREARVIVREDPAFGMPGEQRLVAYVVGGADAKELRAGLRRSLPEYMVPSAYVAMDVLPLTPNGKLDIRALPAPERTAAGEEHVAPRTPVEEVLAGIWAAVLGTERVGARENFFDLGGHSLLATRVAARARAALGVEVPLRALFEAPTVAGLAARVEALLREGAGAAAGPIARVPRDGRPLPLSPGQQRLWFIDRLEPGSSAYNMPFPLRLRGALDARALAAALTEVARRHEALRTVFHAGDGGPVQIVLPAAPFPLPVVDLGGLPEDARGAESERLAAGDAARPFDLARGPLVRGALLRMSGDDALLLLCMHHVVADGWSLRVLLRELSVLYPAFAAGGESPLPEPPVQYADFAAWQQARLADEALEGQLGYWRERLRGAPPLLELPTDRPRPAVAGDRGGGVAFALPPETAAALRALARREGATLFAVLLAGFQALLARYSGSEDVPVGTAAAGRTRLETEGLIGFFVNTLVLRAELPGGLAGSALVAQARERVLEAHVHQDVPFERLVEELRVERTRAHSPLFQAMFTFDPGGAPGQGARLGGVEVEPVRPRLLREKFDLTLEMGDDGERLEGGLSYRTDLWEAATVERMAGHFAALLQGLASAPGGRVAELPLLGAAERRRLVEEWSRAPGARAPTATMHALVAAHAARAPEAVALLWGGERLGYGELVRRANRLASHLRRLGVGPETRVGVLLERSPEMVVALLGILAAGGAYVPMDPGYPRERLAYMLADCGAAVLVTVEPLLERCPPPAGAAVCLDRDAAAIARESDDAPRVEVSPEGLAFIVYTSGSTGEPKGTEVPHRAVPGVFLGVDYARFDAGETHLQHSSTSWDALVLELWGALLTGGRCVLYPGRSSEPGLLGEQLREHGVTTLWLTSAYFNLVVDSCPEILAGVRQLMTGGDSVSAAHLRRARELYPEMRLVNGYGPSECTVFASCHVVPRDVAGGAVPIGRPVGDRRVHLLDAGGEPVPAGVPGELFVGGPAVGRGYRDRPELTAAKFVPDPFADAGAAGARLYRTGDLARWRPDGTLEFVGRTDFQAKIRGFRVEPGEVEETLAGHPGVRQAAVVVRGDAGGERRLVAYAVPEASAEAAPAALRAWLGERLPDYMVPAAVVLLETMPLTPNGKTDRRALPAPDWGAAGQAYRAPRGEVEEILCGIWSTVLGIDRVGVDDDFFALGGHSLLATRVVSRAVAALGVEIPLRALFEAPTVAGLAERVEALRRAGLPTLPPVLPAERTGPLPLSFAQQRLWFIDRLDPGSAAYNLAFPLRLRGPLRVPALARALTEVVRRHEALRTVFHVVEGGPVQVILPAAPFPLPTVDLGGLPGDAREAEAGRLAAEDAARPFDLARGPLARGALLRMSMDDALLLLGMHHVVSDGWSLRVLLRELSAIYPAFAAGGASPLPEPPVQYADFAAWQREHLSDEALRGQLDYWRERLAGAPPLLELPTDRPRPAVAGDRGGGVAFALPPETAAALRALARREGATLFAVLLAGFQALLARYSGSEDVPVGAAVAGRTRLETEGLIGFFVNTLVLRAELPGGLAGRALVAQARERVLEAHVHQDVPFERLVEELRVERTRAHSPLFQAMFTFDPGAPGDGLRLGDVEVEVLPAPGAREKFDLTLGMGDDGERLAGGLSGRTDLWEAATMERMAGHFAALLEGLARDPGRRVAELPLLDAVERARVLEEWNATERGYPAGECVHDLVAAQAARTPDAVAVSWRGEPTTYAELERRAGRLASALRRRGVGPESRVGVCLPRTPRLVVALLGVLRAGGAYVPLDPAYPRERLGWMLEDADVGLVLTESGLADRLPEGAAELLLLDREDPSAGPDDAPASGVGPENLSHVIFTSGSTGRPKGVMIRHSSVVVLLRWLRETVSDEERASVLFSTSVNFDVSVAEVFGTLAWGGKLVLVENALELAALEEPVAYASMVPSAAAELLRSGGIPACVRTLNLGGEALPAALARGLYALGTVERVGNLYGPTEDTTYSTYSLVAPGAAQVLVGRPVANTRAYVLDGELQPTPVGVVGELYLAGDGLARGYAGRPDLTAERWLPDPFGAPGGRMYRVMDRVRWRPGGELEYFGRTDFQVKVRGFRIELGEVEAVLGRHPAVRDVVAVVREDAPGTAGRRIVAYVTGDGVSPAELRAHAAAHLPEYMVPSAAVVLDALPLTPSGKVDRRALPAPGAAPARDGAGPLAPRDETELALVRVWEEVLGATEVGVRDDFFALGGHSLLAVRLLARVERATGVRLPLAVLFTASTVEALAAELRRGRPAGERSPLVPIRPEGEGTPLFLVHPVGGNVLAYAALARHLDPRRPLYALRSRGLAEGEAPAAGVEEMAADYLRAVRAVQPAGPYRLGGWSMGGVVAFEMARQLEAAGEAAELLALIDAHLPALHGRAHPGDERALARTFAADLGLPPGELELPEDGGGGSYLRRVLQGAHAAGVLPADVDAGRMEQLYAVFRSNLAALHAYPAKPYGGAVLLLRAAEHDPADTDTVGWERVAGGGVELHVVPGSHFTLLREPNAAALAALLEGRTPARAPLAADQSPMEETGCR